MRSVSARVGGGRVTDAAAVRRHAKKLDDVAELAVTAGAQLFLDLVQRAVQFRRGLGIEFLDAVRRLADHVVTRGLAEIDFVERGAVVKKRAAHEADLLKGR